MGGEKNVLPAINERQFKADCQKARSLSETEIIEWIKA